jgi:hypothetical protein
VDCRWLRLCTSVFLLLSHLCTHCRSSKEDLCFNHHTHRMSRMYHDRRPTSRLEGGLKQIQLSATDLLALASMKNAANCDK